MHSDEFLDRQAKKHGDDLLEVIIEFFERFALAVRARKTGDVSNVEARFRTTLDDGGEGTHGYEGAASNPESNVGFFSR